MNFICYSIYSLGKLFIYMSPPLLFCINEKDGFIWKIWTENAQKNKADGEIIIYTIGSRPVYSLVTTLLHQAFTRLNDEEKAMSTLRLVLPVSCDSYLISSRPTLLLSHYLCNQRLYHAE